MSLGSMVISHANIGLCKKVDTSLSCTGPVQAFLSLASYKGLVLLFWPQSLSSPLLVHSGLVLSLVAMWLLPLHDMLLFQHNASELHILLSPYSLALVHWQVPPERVSQLNHVILLLDPVSFVCDMAFMFDMVHLVLLALEVVQDAWISDVLLYPGPESDQEAEHLFVSSIYCAAS